MHRAIRRAAILAAAITAGVGIGMPSALATDSTTGTSYVSPTGSSAGSDTSCTAAGYSSIQAAVAATPAGGTVIVCAGTYHESVTLTNQITLQGRSGAVIDATGMPYGVGIAASWSTVSGLTIKNAHADEKTHAPGDGIVTAGIVNGAPVPSSHDLIEGNHVMSNDGSGIDLLSTSHTVVANNVSKNNGVGINVSNDFGPAASHNRIVGNTASHNPGGCGIVLADHTGAGVFDNVVAGNTANNNGLGTPTRPNASSGSGIILAAGGKTGGVYGNVLKLNSLSGNGHGGVALHGHSKGPNFSKNEIIKNTIGKNNVRTDYKDKKSTGVYLGDVSKLKITVANNLFHHEVYAVFAAGHITVKGKGSNGYVNVRHHYKHIKTYAG